MHEDSEIRRLLGDTVSRAVLESMPGLLVAARTFAARSWDSAAQPPADPLERRFGPVGLTISRRWMPQPPDPRRLAWLVEDSAMITLSAMGSKNTPTLEAYLDQRGAVTHDGYYRIGARELYHPSGMNGRELGETAPQLPERPIRYLRLLRMRRAILMLSVEASGSLPESIGAAFASAFHSIRVEPRLSAEAL